MVSVNHRLNVLGFLDLGQYGEQYAASANASLFDLVAALEWVRDNIDRFGGDPDNVMLFGQSGGGGKITALLNSPHAKGLFHKAATQSGSFATSYRPQSVARDVSAAVLDELDIDADNVDAIQRVPHDALLAASKRALRTVRSRMGDAGSSIGGWGPVQDGHFFPLPAFGDEATALAADVPLLIGTTKTEFVGFAAAATGEDLKATMASIKTRYGERADEYAAAVERAYPTTSKASDYVAVDLMFRVGAVRDADRWVAARHEQTYVYLFEWESPTDDGGLKSMHCMELPFVFDNIHLARELTGVRKEAYRLASSVSAAWVNFARSGRPTPPVCRIGRHL